MKYVLATIGILFSITLVGFGLKILLFPVHTAQNLINTAYDASDKTLNADNAIYNYEWFKQQYEDINVAKAKYSNSVQALDDFKSQLSEDRAKWDYLDREEYNRLNSIVLGTKQYVEELIGNYNARTKMANRNIFQNSIIPNFIDAITFLKK